jgi:hypothetical protein
MLVVTAPCNLISAPDKTNVSVTAHMSDDRIITVHTADPRNPGFPDELLKPGARNYDETLQMVGGLSPGQTKRIPQFIGSISMAEDGSYRIRGCCEVTDLRIVRVGDKDYARIRASVGALKPGEWALLKVPPAGTC